jgi:hypothetical protein
VKLRPHSKRSADVHVNVHVRSVSLHELWILQLSLPARTMNLVKMAGMVGRDVLIAPQEGVSIESGVLLAGAAC